jgi:hypothetical protein
MLKMKSRHVAGTITKKKKSKCTTLSAAPDIYSHGSLAVSPFHGHR